MHGYGDDVFQGTATYYAKYRAPYPLQLFDDIIQKLKLDGKGRFLDLGFGTGEMAIPLAEYFEKILAIDPDKEMLQEGKKKASNLNISNIEWRKVSSRTLTDVKGPFRLVAMGQSLHWMDGKTVLGQLHELTERGGGVVIVGTVPKTQNEL